MNDAPPLARARILFVDDEASLRRIAQYRLEEAGYEVAVAKDGENGLAEFAAFAPDLVITDIRMPGMDGDALVDEILRREPEVPVIVATGHATVESAVAAMRRGVADYVTKPVSWDEMLLTLQRVLDAAALRRDNRRLRAELAAVRFEGIVGDSESMQAVFRAMERLRDTDTTVLIEGESGTGKELVARALHFQGQRAPGPFVAVNCGAIPAGLVESQLFGHEPGAFTGADRIQRGHFEQAQGGTLFLDEVGEISPEAQVKLLRVLTERKVRRLGGEESHPIDVRVVAATNRDLEAAVADGEFRADLYYRIAVVPLRIPPLRERPEDVVALAGTFATRSAGRPVSISRGAARALRDWRWPGNVRELENVMERAIVLGTVEDVIKADDLPPQFSETEGDPPVPGPTGFPDEGVDLASIERDWITRALRHTTGNRTHAAQLLGITRQTLLYRIQKHGIDIPPHGESDT